MVNATVYSSVLFIEKLHIAPLSDRLSNVYNYNQIDRDVSIDEWLTSFVGVEPSHDDVTDASLIEWVTKYVQINSKAKVQRGID